MNGSHRRALRVGAPIRWGLAGAWILVASGCFSARAVERNYFVLHGDPVEEAVVARPVDGLVRVRDMDTDSVYEKFQIVVRRSPYQLRYSDQNVWAVRPNQMVSDLIAQALESSSSFTGVTRELRDARPAYTLSGRVLAIELFDSGDLWFAHLSMQLQLARFADGASIWTYEFDQRKQIESQSFDHGVRALSELLHSAVTEAIRQVNALDSASARRRSRPVLRPSKPSRSPAITDDGDSTPSLLFVPEGPRRSASPDPAPADGRIRTGPDQKPKRDPLSNRPSGSSPSIDRKKSSTWAGPTP